MFDHGKQQSKKKSSSYQSITICVLIWLYGVRAQ